MDDRRAMTEKPTEGIPFTEPPVRPPVSPPVPPEPAFTLEHSVYSDNMQMKDHSKFFIAEQLSTLLGTVQSYLIFFRKLALASW